MQEVRVFSEGANAITTHRIVWAESGVFDFDDIEVAYVMRNDAWKGLASGVGAAAVGGSIGATWSIGIGLVFLAIGVVVWLARYDTLNLALNNGETQRLKIPREPAKLSDKIHDALMKRRELIASAQAHAAVHQSRAALDEIENLPTA